MPVFQKLFTLLMEVVPEATAEARKAFTASARPAVTRYTWSGGAGFRSRAIARLRRLRPLLSAELPMVKVTGRKRIKLIGLTQQVAAAG